MELWVYFKPHILIEMNIKFLKSSYCLNYYAQRVVSGYLKISLLTCLISMSGPSY